ncbi:AI-2E family transporter [Rubrobacter marinus]|uniref:AI-2E family transporter n=1 Tax=Rubrobacter marinus TaxID=2653852 RepID=UPI00140CD9E6|nr:AI-2E family transporter [Rubrobacter marinus]
MPTTKKLVVSTYLQYIFIAVGALLLFTFVRQIGGVLLTFLLAGVLAYALNPLIRRLETLGVPRVVAVLGVFLGLTAAVLLAALVLIIPAVGQIQALVRDPTAFADGVAGLVERARELPYVGERVSSIDRERLVELASSNAPSAGQILNGALGFIGGVFGVFGTLLNLLLMLIISIYLLLDRERISRATLRAVPRTVRSQAAGLFRAVEGALVKYLRAQLLLCAIMGVLGWAIVYFTGGRFALLIGLWVGLTEIIPVLGAFLGAIPAVLIPLFMGDFTQALIVAALFLVAQQLEGNVLVPRVMGGTTGVHPLWVLFATLAATALYGIVGAVFAVPIVAIISAAWRYLRETLVFERWGKAPVQVLAGGPDEAREAVPAGEGQRSPAETEDPR